MCLCSTGASGTSALSSEIVASSSEGASPSFRARTALFASVAFQCLLDRIGIFNGPSGVAGFVVVHGLAGRRFFLHLGMGFVSIGGGGFAVV
jgi:hypothetical protein